VFSGVKLPVPKPQAPASSRHLLAPSHCSCNRPLAGLLRVNLRPRWDIDQPKSSETNAATGLTFYDCAACSVKRNHQFCTCGGDEQRREGKSLAIHTIITHSNKDAASLAACCLRPHSFPPDWTPTGIDEYNKKIMVASIKDPDLFRVKNKFAHDRYTKRLGINPLVKRCGTNPALRVSCSIYHDE
jgi:hypothetical protein